MNRLIQPHNHCTTQGQRHFDFATFYYYNHQLSSWDNFEISNDDFEDFVKFLSNKGFDYETETEKKFAEAIRKAEDDELQKDIQKAMMSLWLP